MQRVVSWIMAQAKAKAALLGSQSGKSRSTNHVEEAQVLLSLDNLRQLLPLLLRRVDTGRVVGTSVKQNLTLVDPRARLDRLTMEPSVAPWMSFFMPSKSSPIVALSKYLDISTEFHINPKSDLLVSLDLETDRFGKRDVVTPCWVRDPDLLRSGVELAQETSSDSQTTGTRDRLSDSDLRRQRCGVRAVYDSLGLLEEAWSLCRMRARRKVG